MKIYYSISNSYSGKLKNYFIPILFSTFIFFQLTSVSIAQNGNSKKELMTFLECVKYIGNDTYVVTYGYENPGSKDVIVVEDNSVVIYNNGNSKKKVINQFSQGVHSNAFKQVFKGKDRCVWRVILPNGTIKETSASANSNHCRTQYSDIDPLFDGSVEGGVLWPELYWLSEQQSFESNEIFQIANLNTGNESVLVEIVVFEGVNLTDFRNTLSSYGFANEIPNGNNPLVLSGLFPISNLKEFNNEPLSLSVNFVRPILTPFTNGQWTYSGIVGTQQDLAMRSNIGRDAFNADGTGTTICIISDSYGDPSVGIGSGDLPGLDKMEVLSDLSSIGPFSGTREGAAMVELIYDIAPGANYKFWTGTASPGYMAYGITQFVEEGCDIGVDDVTHLTEPFMPIGQIANAVEYAKNAGMHYVTSAGNFDNLSFRGNFTNASIPQNFGDFAGTLENAHDFGGKISQGVSLTPGVYIVVMQWDDEFWAQGQTPGADHDLNIWFVDDAGNFKYFGNRDNNGDEFDPTGEDPIEILGFRVLNPTTLNIMITGADIPEGLPFQYIVFKAPGNGWQFTDPGMAFNATTVVGHAASSNASSVGAAFYGYTPEFENQANMLEPFTSKGGLNLIGTQLSKPDFTAPDGGNTTFFGQVVNYDNDQYPNFFGTSAAAPAVAAGMALVLETSKRYYNKSGDGQPLKNEFSPEILKTLLSETSLDIDAPGPDLNSGSGLIQLDKTLLSLANPSPQILELILEEGKTPGLEPITLTIVVQYPVVDENGNPVIGEGGTEILFREESLPLTEDNWAWVTNAADEYIIEYNVVIPEFIGNPPITITNPTTGGGSETKNLLDKPKIDLLVKAGNATKLFGEDIPVDDFSYSLYLVDNTDPNPANWEEFTSMTPEEKAAFDTSISLVAEYTGEDGTVNPVTFLSEVGSYPIKVKGLSSIPVGLTEIYNFIGFEDDNIGYGALKIDPLPVTVIPDNLTVEYGSKLYITLTYDFMTSNIPDSAAVAAYIIQSHNELLVPDYIAIANRGLALVDEGTTSLENRGLALVDRGLALVDRGLALVDGSSWMLTLGALGNRGLALVDGANNVYDIGIDVAADFILEDPTVAYNRGLALVDRGLALVDGQTIFEAGDGGVPFIDNRGLALVDRGLALVDRGLALVDEEGNSVEKNFKLFFLVSDEDTEINDIRSVNFVTGLDVLPNGLNHYIAPGALLNPNLSVTSQLGELQILPRTIKVAVEDIPVNKEKSYGADDPNEFTFQITEGALVPGDGFTGNLDRTAGENIGQYAINEGNLKAGPVDGPVTHPFYGLNYNIILDGDPVFTINKTPITVSADNQTMVYGTTSEPALTWQITSGSLFFGDQIDGELSRDSGNDVGNYAINQNSLTLTDNYDFVFIPGTFTITPATIEITADDQTMVYGPSPEPTLTWQITGGSLFFDDLVNGDLSRDPGNNVGNYTIGKNTLNVSDNYTLEFVSGSFTITPAAIEITADDQTMVYGTTSEPALTWRITGGSLFFGDQVSGELSREPGSDAGTYSILENTLIINDNYNLTFIPGSFFITRALLTVIAQDNYIYEGDPLPEFTAVISGFLNGDNEANVFSSPATYEINPPYVDAGIYNIIPVSRNMYSPENYTVEYINGTLYVNDNENGARKIKVFCDCIDEVPGDPDGLYYVAHFYYENPNDYEINILEGTENYISTEGIYEGLLPETFLPGVGHVDVRFDGNKIVWNLISYNTNNKTSSTTDASSNTKKCNLNGNNARIAAPDQEQNSSPFNLTEIKGYPNPASDLFYVSLNELQMAEVKVGLVDMSGRMYDVRMTRNISNRRLEIDLTNLDLGLYLLKLDFQNQHKILKVIKQ